MQNAQFHQVVLIGGGFGGLYAAKALRRAPVRATLVDKRNFHLFQPLLYQVATGSLSSGDIAYPLRSVFAHDDNLAVIMAKGIWRSSGAMLASPISAACICMVSWHGYYGCLCTSPI